MLAWVLPVVGLPLLLEQVVRPRVRGLDTVPGPLRTDAGPNTATDAVTGAGLDAGVAR
ncbi:hypothetical protein [Streptomyces mirabilis]|uniref:hypothetical protein n=1 Tax=Streptomyces mirabilis TaxID=68239 RepID=UPI003327611D